MGHDATQLREEIARLRRAVHARDRVILELRDENAHLSDWADVWKRSAISNRWMRRAIAGSDVWQNVKHRMAWSASISGNAVFARNIRRALGLPDDH